MKDILKKQQKKGVNPMVVAAAGVAVGVGVAVAASNALNDKKNKKKVDNFVADVKDKALDVRDRATGYLENAKQKPEVKKANKVVKSKVVKKAKKVKKTK